MLRTLLAASLLAMLSACATPPANYSVSNSKAYQRPYDQVWEDLVSIFATRSIPVKSLAKDSGVIFAEASRFDDLVADCGKPGLYVVVDRRATFNVFVTRSASKPTVSVNSEFFETRRFQNTVVTVRCNSKGVLETTILSVVS